MGTWHLDRHTILLWLGTTLNKELSVFILCVIYLDLFLSSLFSLVFLYIEQPVLAKCGSVCAVTDTLFVQSSTRFSNNKLSFVYLKHFDKFTKDSRKDKYRMLLFNRHSLYII
jgi:hypothetical protein